MLRKENKTLLDRITTKGFVVVMGMVFVIVYILSNTILESHLMTQTNGNTFVEANIFYASKLGDILQAYGEIGRTYYVRLLILFDFIFPLQYSLFFASCLILLLKKLASISLKRQKTLLLLGGILCLTDWLENIFIIIAIHNFPEIPGAIPLLAQTMTLAKAALTIAFLIAILISAVMLCVNKIKKPSRQRSDSV